MKTSLIFLMVVAISALSDALYINPFNGHQGGVPHSPAFVFDPHLGPTLVQSNDHHQHSWANHWNHHHGQFLAHNHQRNVHPVPASPNVLYQQLHHHQYHPSELPNLGHPAQHHHTHHQQQHPMPAATYVAANPGAIHKAPLPGHSVNQHSLNLATAQGSW
ncbi:uncharacterized histidine-rich protein DDB_G0274557-like isoform X1 [Uranotaenia lowii]|uniref:uncharacterized histidine-rich protein DDB_G0274557-like isoform X1 n=2 Tax=Uranotaenia lowii TaxID=190385 RepID=UPI00247A5754|nr:uncharacterized histidine-rich protein DDB_G0274557-like isoform X1 [Uranotaenia lowii]